MTRLRLGSRAENASFVRHHALSTSLSAGLLSAWTQRQQHLSILSLLGHRRWDGLLVASVGGDMRG